MEETSPRLEGLLLPSSADVSVLSLGVSHEAIRIDVCSTAAGAACPDCGSEIAHGLITAYRRVINPDKLLCV
ncbi:hypothetical protein [Streptomyces sp. NPDC047841]|uniref:hypothetical protein n=1 Tax=Streptomyces sp. NPDC047841 TaxID=3154708 RepID=UPI0034572387